MLRLKYVEGRTPVVTGLKRISKPGLRVYARKTEIPRVLGGLGLAILSTSHGIMTGNDARKQNLGGEVLCLRLVKERTKHVPYRTNADPAPVRSGGHTGRPPAAREGPAGPARA